MKSDVLGVILVYAYVAILLLISEKILKKYPLLSRKFLHIMVGNIIFLLPIFETRWAMAFIAAAPFILITFLLSPYSPLKIPSTASMAGHGLGLVYYSISWTLLAFLFFQRPEIIAVGIGAMSYGDGFASLIGKKIGKRKYIIGGNTKSIEGSLSMFFATLIILFISLLYYQVLEDFHSIVTLVLVSLGATVVEGITPKGLDNLSVSLLSALMYYALAG